ncbi:hypothetical protein VTK26DRAFT_6360 [Humicola hyalothermophila]
MVTYTSSVSKPETASDVPEDVRRPLHHIKGHHGKTIKFKNPHPSAGEPLVFGFSTLKKVFGAWREGLMDLPDTTKHKIPIVKPSFLTSRGGQSALRATWIGHSTYFVEFPSGLRVLFDPVFECRCSPVQFYGPKRFTPPACELSELPPLDAVIISHSHYDHLSHGSVLTLAKNNPEAHFFVGLGLEAWFRRNGITKVTEMDWWQDAELVLTKDLSGAAGTNADKEKEKDAAGDDKTAPDTITARISCLPSQHSSGRSSSDQDQTLWASWAVASGGKSVWFGGDTGYRRVPRLPEDVDDYGPEYESLPRNPQFAQIGAHRGPFDLGLIPIGAYRPRFLFSSNHANPYDAVEIFKETRCERAMAIHWGTWTLTSEEVEEPPVLLREALRKSGLAETGLFDVCAIGESREF